jgi:hypothetical protein
MSRSAQGLAARKERDKLAKAKARRNAGVLPRTKLSVEEERERSRQCSAIRKLDAEKRAMDNETRRKRTAEKRKDPLYRAVCNIRSRISTACSNGFTKPGSTIGALGCSLPELKLWLEKQFLPGMSWENYGRKGWHVDHVREVCTFDLSDPAQFSACNHYTNLQPLWASDNLAKEHERRMVARGDVG